MGRTYLVEEAIGQYLSDLTTKLKPYVTGLLIGQVSVKYLKSNLLLHINRGKPSWP